MEMPPDERACRRSYRAHAAKSRSRRRRRALVSGVGAIALLLAPTVEAEAWAASHDVSVFAAAAANPCTPAPGSLGQRIVRSLQCSLSQSVLEAECGFSVAGYIIPAIKALRVAKTANGLYDLSKASPRFRPWAKALNLLSLAKYTKRAPRLVATPTAAIGALGHGVDLATWLPALIKGISVRDFEKVATALAGVAGLHACLAGLANALEVGGQSGTGSIKLYVRGIVCPPSPPGSPAGSSPQCTSEPLEGAVVSVSGYPAVPYSPGGPPPPPPPPVYCLQRTVVTDSAGVAKFTGCPAGHYGFPTIRKSGWAFGDYRPYMVGHVVEGETTSQVEYMRACSTCS